MPILKDFSELSQSRLDNFPKRNTSTIQLMLAYDICSWKVPAIAKAVGLSEARVYIIRNSPLYKSQREQLWEELREQVTGRKAEAIVAGDPIELKIKELAVRAIEKKEFLLDNSKAEVQNAVASDLLDRAGYTAEKKKIKASFELSAKTAQRFERILRRQEPSEEIEKSAKIELEIEQ